MDLAQTLVGFKCIIGVPWIIIRHIIMLVLHALCSGTNVLALCIIM